MQDGQRCNKDIYLFHNCFLPGKYNNYITLQLKQKLNMLISIVMVITFLFFYCFFGYYVVMVLLRNKY